MFQCAANQEIRKYCSQDYKAYNKSLDIYDYFLFDDYASEQQKGKRKNFRNVRQVVGKAKVREAGTPLERRLFDSLQDLLI